MFCTEGTAAASSLAGTQKKGHLELTRTFFIFNGKISISIGDFHFHSFFLFSFEFFKIELDYNNFIATLRWYF